MAALIVVAVLRPTCLSLVWLIGLTTGSAAVLLDSTAVRPGPITVESTPEMATVRWSDEQGKHWAAGFWLEPRGPLIHSIAVESSTIVENAIPLYSCSTGKRRGGWDQFFDFPPSHPDGTRSFVSQFKLKSAIARSRGDRVEIEFDGLTMGIFNGAVRFTFFPGTRLVLQEAIVRTHEPDTAYYYDSGIRMAAGWAVRSGGNMEADVSSYDNHGQFQAVAAPSYSERIFHQVRYRTLAVRAGSGAIAVFPAPHRYFFARDYTTNMGYLWHTAWRGNLSIGVRQLPDDNSPYYPWMNAPPDTEQRMGVFYLLGSSAPRAVLDEVLRYTNRDRFEALQGYRTFAPHWHFAYTVQAMTNGFEWVPPFKSVLKDMGVDSAMIMDFHGDGHPQDTADLRLSELDAYYRACRAQSGRDFLLIPAEEANVHLGGHWALAFPKPVYWMMKHPAGTPFRSTDPRFGTVYRVGNANEMLDLIRSENGLVYQTHPRTKGSTGFPDQIRDADYFRDQHYIGAGWKAMPSDLSSPRLGERAFRTLDDMNNWGLSKNLVGEADIFQLDSTHELYAHMNVNYVRLAELPSFDRYSDLLDAVRRGQYFTTTGEVLLPEVSIAAGKSDEIVARAQIRHRFPLEMVEVVWGDGKETYRKLFPIAATRQFTTSVFEEKVEAKNWKWARLAVWDIAANGAFVNPVRRSKD